MERDALTQLMNEFLNGLDDLSFYANQECQKCDGDGTILNGWITCECVYSSIALQADAIHWQIAETLPPAHQRELGEKLVRGY